MNGSEWSEYMAMVQNIVAQILHIHIASLFQTL